MKLSKVYFLFLAIPLALFLKSCFQDECTSTRVFYQYDPVYKSVPEIRNSFSIVSARPLRAAGKIYVYGDYLFINEPKEGIHIVDNSNPEFPVFKSFISIMGNVDMAIRDGILYADNYIDLLAIDIHQVEHPMLICRIPDVFKPIGVDPIRGLLVDYRKSEQTRVLSCNDRFFSWGWFQEGDLVFSSDKRGNASGGSSAPIGLGGSQARFTIHEDYLYTVDISELYAFNLTNSCPVLESKNIIGWNIETIYPYDNKLFIGSQNGMFMYGLTNPAKPHFISTVQHWRSCDPVVADGNRAYVTLHGGTECGGFTNQLDIIDITNIESAYILKSHPMKKPLGLGIKQNILYLCDDGLKVMDVTDWNDLKLMWHDSNVTSYDVIVYPDREQIILVGEAGVIQYNTENKRDLKILSNIRVIQ